MVVVALVVVVVLEVVVVLIVFVVVVEGGWNATPASPHPWKLDVVNDAGKSVGEETPDVAYSNANDESGCEKVNPVPPEKVQFKQTIAARRKEPGANVTLLEVETAEAEQADAQPPLPSEACACAVVTPPTSKMDTTSLWLDPPESVTVTVSDPLDARVAA